MSLIETRDLWKTYVMGGEEIHALRGVSIQIDSGEYVAIMGPSGSGKSTLMNLIGCLDTPTKGSYLLNGKEVVEMDDDELARIRNEEIGFVFQTFNLLPRATALHNVELPLVYAGIPGKVRQERARQALEKVELTSRATHRPNELSGGQRQRVAIARALVLRPRIVVCDEPTSALDVSVQAQILNLLAELRRDLGLTYLFISHNLAVVEHVASEVAVMYLGRLVEREPTETLFARPEHPYTMALLASVLTPEPGLGVPDVGLGDSLPDPANIPAGCRFHPRCPIAEPRCATTTPPLKPRPNGGVECLLV
jgi:peptide/nickel transport system ATP-binding protein